MKRAVRCDANDVGRGLLPLRMLSEPPEYLDDLIRPRGVAALRSRPDQRQTIESWSRDARRMRQTKAIPDSISRPSLAASFVRKVFGILVYPR